MASFNVENFNRNPYTKLGKNFIILVFLILNVVATFLRGGGVLPPPPSSTDKYNWAELCLGSIPSNGSVNDAPLKVEQALGRHPIFPFGVPAAGNKPPIPHFVTVCSSNGDSCLSFSSREWCDLLLGLGEYHGNL